MLSCVNFSTKDDYMDSFEHRAGWHRYYTESRDRFPVKYVISFMNFYPNRAAHYSAEYLNCWAGIGRMWKITPQNFMMSS